MTDDLHGRARYLATTSELIDYYTEETHIPRAVLEAAIRDAINALYTGRDHGGNMHSSGAAAAVAALLSARTWELH